MKKICAVTLCLVSVICFVFMGCSGYRSLTKAFEEEGYTVYTETERFAEYQNHMYEIADENGVSITLCVVYNEDTGLLPSGALIVKFKSADDMKKLYDASLIIQSYTDYKGMDSENGKALKRKLEREGFVKNDCLVVPMTGTSRDIICDIVRNA